MSMPSRLRCSILLVHLQVRVSLTLAVPERFLVTEIFVLGCGAQIDRPSEELKAFVRDRGIMLELVDSVSAIDHSQFGN